MEKENVLFELKKNIQEDKLIKIVFSDRQSGDFNKVIIKPIILKSTKNIQIESFKDNKAFHKNIDLNNLQELEYNLKEYIDNFKQILLQIEGSDISFIRKKENFSRKEKESNLIKTSNEHNKKKQYILNEGDKIDFLIELGLMSIEGKILKSSYNKFKQINKYLEFIDDVIEELKAKKLITNHINVLDFGCGKSYLTFALYYYLKNYRKDLTFSIVGLDLKKDVIEFCNKVAKKLNYENLEFYNTLKIMADNGVVLDKFATLATYSFRSLSLELCGYKTKMIEFIDMEHTPKNILIRAIKSKSSNLKEKLVEYNKLKEFLGIKPLLEDLIKKYFLIDTNTEIPYN